MAHSIQLLMEDLYKVPPLHEACRMAEAVLVHFSDVDESAKLDAVQVAAGRTVLIQKSFCAH